jgi:glutamate/tyrosine decarboxylase-like PLP-dependent enzyme
MFEMDQLLADVAQRAARYLAALPKRRVSPAPQDLTQMHVLGGPFPAAPTPASAVVALLDEIGSPATIASAGGRYFGYVTGGALPAALATNWLAAAWDQNASLSGMSPVAAALEDVALAWLRDIFGFPAACGAGFTTGATMSNFCCLAAARSELLRRVGWDVEERGLFGAPELTVVVGREAHVSVRKALSLLGLGRSRVSVVPSDDQGRMLSDALPTLDHRTIVCIQAGNVNTGAFDPATEICTSAREAGAWVHVDGAFGLWAAASPERAHLFNGVSGADSWATDCHKWLNVPYDSGLAFVREADHLRRAMAVSAAYLAVGETREPAHYAPEMSRRARGVEVWAALKSLGRSGLAEMIEMSCCLATRFAEGLSRAGYLLLNQVELNQVLVSFGDSETNKRVIAAVQKEGTCWCSGTEWNGRHAMRISVSSWATTQDDVDRSLEAIVRVASELVSLR